MEPPSDPARQAPAVRRLADWLDRQWSALGELGRTAVVLGSLAAVSLGVLAAWTDWVKDIRGTPLLVAAAMPEKATGVAAAAWLDPRAEGPEVRLWVLFRARSGRSGSGSRSASSRPGTSCFPRAIATPSATTCRCSPASTR